MKLKYLVETDDKYLFANSLDDLASYYKITLASMRYRMKNKLVNITKINIKLQHLTFDYTIDKNGVVIAMINDCKDYYQSIAPKHHRIISRSLKLKV